MELVGSVERSVAQKEQLVHDQLRQRCCFKVICSLHWRERIQDEEAVLKYLL